MTRMRSAEDVRRRSDPVRVMIVDNHAMVVRGLALGLNRYEQLEVVATATSLVEGVALAHEVNPDIALLDAESSGPGLATAIQALRGAAPNAAVLVFSAQLDEEVAAQSLSAGACGAMDKSQSLPALARAIEACARGEKMVVDKRLLPGILRRLRAGSQPTLFPLTPRERQVLLLLDEGYDTHRIAQSLGIARNTARNYVQSVLVKLGAHSQLEAVAIARREGLLA